MRSLRLTLAASALLWLGLTGPAALAAPAEPDPPGGGASTMVIGGEDATEPYPFMASLQTTANEHFCGGSLLDAEWVVTAWHCVADKQPADVRLRIGSHHHADGGSLRDAQRIVPHPEGNWNHFDIALVKLDQPVPEAPIALDTRQATGTPTRLLGWGCTAPGPNTGCETPDVLKQLDSAIREPSTCRHVTGGAIQPASEVCTGNPETEAGPCFGDSGGPLLRRTAGGWRLIGAFSRVESLPQDPDKPQPQFPDCHTGLGIYTDVTVHAEWIDSVISPA
ncbi:serine protease [Actinomadura graeca]|uniref:Serine protease n=1 Tax=Actinomadura graeca TaxID=2750812 RepID=A0ABX8QPI4_9ACTN|nr:serine protease [Actinomadura graeca]QXJ20698.1 serine protease [Actinomadura graeca]